MRLSFTLCDFSSRLVYLCFFIEMWRKTPSFRHGDISRKFMLH